MAGAVSAPAQARDTAILIMSDVVAGWGNNAQGQLGDGTTPSRSLYGDIRVGNDVVQVAAGSGHGLALRSDGTVWAWGPTRGRAGRRHQDQQEHGGSGDGVDRGHSGSGQQ